jgi:thiamine-phosphate pyrophosphorylase
MECIWKEQGRLRNALRLYAVTDRRWLAGQTLADRVEKILQGGATFLQLREKELDKEALLQEARLLRELCSRYRVPFVLDDDVETALRSGADGVHLGQKDMAIEEARKLLGPDRIIGMSARTVEQALDAQERGADYLGVGAVFGTSTKGDAVALPREILQAICEAVSIPVVAIGGIQEKNILELRGTGVDGAAVVSALFAAEDPRSAAERLYGLTGEIIRRTEENRRQEEKERNGER